MTNRRKKYTQEEARDKAIEIVLSCSICGCGHSTDHKYNNKEKVWIGICECGQTTRKTNTFVESEVNKIATEFYKN